MDPSITKQNMEFRLSVTTKIQTCEAGIGAKSKEIYLDAVQPGRMVDSHFKDHFNPSAQAHTSYRDMEGAILS